MIQDIVWQPRHAADTSTNWRQSLSCCCTASMEQATNEAETAAIDGLISSWSENIAVSFCLRAPGQTDSVMCPRSSSRGHNTSASVTVTVTNSSKPEIITRVTVVAEVQRWYIGNSRQAVLEHLAASSTKSIATQIQLHILHGLVQCNAEQHTPGKWQTNSSQAQSAYSVPLNSTKFYTTYSFIQDSTDIQSVTATWISKTKFSDRKKTRGKYQFGFCTTFHSTHPLKLIYIHIQTCKQQTYTVVSSKLSADCCLMLFWILSTELSALFFNEHCCFCFSQPRGAKTPGEGGESSNIPVVNTYKILFQSATRLQCGWSRWCLDWSSIQLWETTYQQHGSCSPYFTAEDHACNSCCVSWPFSLCWIFCPFTDKIPCLNNNSNTIISTFTPVLIFKLSR